MPQNRGFCIVITEFPLSLDAKSVGRDFQSARKMAFEHADIVTPRQLRNVSNVVKNLRATHYTRTGKNIASEVTIPRI